MAVAEVSLVDRARRAWRETGGRALLASLARRVVHVRVHSMLAAPPETEPPAESPALAWRWLTLQQVEALQSDAAWLYGRATVTAARRWLARGDRCLGGYVDRVLVTTLWVTTSVRTLPRCVLEVGPGVVYVYKTFTHPDWRGRGFNRAALRWVRAWAGSQGCRRVVIDVARQNTGSTRAIEAAGFVDVGRFLEVSVLDRRRVVMPRRLRRVIAGRE